MLQQYGIKALPLGEKGCWGILYAAIRKEDREQAYFIAFIKQAKAIIATHLEGIIPIDSKS
nr:hypothetical protein [sulfur-oxidizing endosymbiont of Gigantopelta aegis]